MKKNDKVDDTHRETHTAKEEKKTNEKDCVESGILICVSLMMPTKARLTAAVAAAAAATAAVEETYTCTFPIDDPTHKSAYTQKDSSVRLCVQCA